MSNWINSAFSLFATGMQVFGELEAGNQMSQMAAYNAGLKLQDAQVAEEEGKYNAFLAAEDARISEANFREEGNKLESTQRTNYAKSGVAVTGSPLAVMAETAAELELDALTIRYGGKLKSDAAEYAGKTKAAALRAEAEALSFGGAQAYNIGKINAGTSLIGGISKWLEG